jgi:hypothetical protein
MAVTATILAGAFAVVAQGAAAKPRKANPRLHAFGSCGTLLTYARRNGVRLIRTGGTGGGIPLPPRGVGGGGGADEDGGSGGGAIGGPTPVAAPAPARGEGGNSQTNLQEAGVDEPDIVKTVGSRLYAVAGDRLHAIDAGTSPPVRLGSVKLPGYGHELLVHGDRALVFSEAGGGVPLAMARAARASGVAPVSRWLSRTLLTEIAIADPGAMRVLRTLDVEGSYLSARLTGSTARVVVSSTPRGLSMPDVSDDATWSQIRRRWRRSVHRSRTSKWLPAAVLREHRSGRKRARALVRCRQVKRARVFSGLDTVSVLTIDMERGLPAVDVDALMTDADTVYASENRLFVATERWLGADPSRREAADLSATGLHGFSTGKEGSTTYVGSGEVPGYLLNQWSLSEKDGILRVATTDQPPWDSRRDTESSLRTLEERDGRLVELGRVGGMGKGERIYAVRYIGDAAYVVTFRQTDPLYTIDLSDPRNPRRMGELKVPGYSAYLHPVGDGRLLGVGQDADSRGRTLGVQLSLFDVSDLRAPTRLAKHSFERYSYTEVEEDHHAFLWWEPERLAVIPVVSYGENFDEERSFASAFRIGPTAIEPVAHVFHPPRAEGYADPFRRSVVVGSRLLLLSDAGVLSTAVSAPGPGDFVSLRG